MKVKFRITFIVIFLVFNFYFSVSAQVNVNSKSKFPNIDNSDFYENKNYIYQQNLNSKHFCLKNNFIYNQNEEDNKRNILKDIKDYFFMYLEDGWYCIKAPTRLNKKKAFWLSAVLIAGGTIYAYDQNLMEGIDRNRTHSNYKSYTKVCNKVEKYGLAKIMNPIYVGGAIVGYVLKIKPLEEASVQLHESLFIGSLLRQVIVHLVGRTRPYKNKGAKYFKFNGGNSFFSGHTTNAFEMATIISHHIDFWPVTVLCYGFASSIAFQRLHVKSHWPSDVFIGAVYGTVIAKTIIKLHEKRKVKTNLIFSPEVVGLKLSYEF